MKKIVSYILCLLTISVFILIFLQEKNQIFKFDALNGVNNEPKVVELTFENLYQGKYQSYLETHLRYHFGFRELLIRIHNQYIWDFYHKSTNNTVYVGKDNWLFGQKELMNYFQSGMYEYTDNMIEMKNKCLREAVRLHKVQNILDEYGVFVFVSLLPSKAFIYPEYIPNNIEYDKEPFHAIYYYPLVFDSLGINYINIQKIFENQKNRVDYPLFPKTGMHWSYIAAEHAFDTTLRFIEHKANLNLHNYSIGEKYTDKPKHPDTDLEDIMDLLHYIKPNKNYYADVTVDDDTTAIKPSLIIVGDSFFWNINGSVPLTSIFSKYYFWYYNSTIYSLKSTRHTSQVDILDEIINCDIINLAYSPRQLYIFSNNFIPKALLYLTHEDSDIDGTLNAIASSLDSASEEEKMKIAKERLFSEPEKYFPDLDTYEIPITRNSRITEIIKKGANN